jgi:conjugal transfer pilus assembly protein TraB
MNPMQQKPTSPILNPGGDPNRKPKTPPSKWLIGLIGLVVLAVGTVGLNQFRTAGSHGARAQAQSKPVSLDAAKTDQEIWRAEAGKRIEALSQEKDELRRMIDALRLRMEAKEKEPLKPESRPTGDGRADKTAVRNGVLPPPLPPTWAQGPDALNQRSGTPPRVPGTASAPIPARQVGSEKKEVTVAPPDGIRTFRVEPVSLRTNQPKKYWLPTGTIVPVKLLSGLDAPARTAGATGGGGGAMGNSPSPILMQIRDLMKLPNDFRVHATDCFLMGEGLAELSSERVQIRGVNISCVRQNGTAVDMTIKGFVAGEDGKAGMRGPVVMKEGAMLARSLLAGFVSGISRAFMPFQQGFVISSSPSQAFTFPPAGQLAMAGVAGGAGNAASLLARHYAVMASSIFPIIEISADREVDFIVSDGKELEEFFLSSSPSSSVYSPPGSFNPSAVPIQ